MVVYEVTLEIDPALADAVEAHMRREHIPDIAATGCFQRIRLERASPSRFRTRYEAGTEIDLNRYLRDHAPRLRVDFQRHFPVGVTATRETWTPLESWG